MVFQNTIAPFQHKCSRKPCTAPCGKRGKFLWIAQKHTGNISCILSTPFAKLSYAMPLSTHGATGADSGKEKYPCEYLTEEKFYPPKHIRRIFQSTLRRTPRYDMRSDNHTHQWRACRRPVIFAGEKAGNHLPLLFRALYTAGNRGNVRKLPEYSVASYTSPRGKTFSDVTATPKNVTASASTGKSRKPPTRSENTVTPWRT